MKYFVFLLMLSLAQLLIAHNFTHNGFISLEHELELIKNDIRNNNIDDFCDRISYLNEQNLIEKEHLIALFYKSLYYNFYEGVKALLFLRPEFATEKLRERTPIYVALNGYRSACRKPGCISEDRILGVIQLLCINGAYGAIDSDRNYLIYLADYLKLMKVSRYLTENYINAKKPLFVKLEGVPWNLAI
jgi:hypothetical protein